MSSSRKKVLFTFILIAIPFIILLLSELLLRAVVPSPYPEMVAEVSYDGRDWYQIQRGYLKKFFPASGELVPEFKPSLFLKNKPENGFRVICLGGSSMFGTPYQMTSTIPGIVRKQLRHLYPGREVEVINFAASAINSHVIKRFASEMIRFDPDLILIYMGHNEFYGPDGVGATWLEKKLPFFISMKYQLREVRIYQLLQKFISGIFSPHEIPSEPNLMKQVSRGNLVRLESDDARRIFRSFEENLENIISVFRDREIPVIISDVASNLFFKPFAWDSLQGITDQEIWLKRLEEACRAGEYRHAFEMVLPVLDRNLSNAIVNYQAGICYFQLKDPQKADFHLRVARNNDLLKFRAPDEIDRIIREVCRRNEVPVISAEKYLYENSEHGIPGFDLFWEHLHLNTEGYYLIARLFVEKIAELNLVFRGDQVSPHPDLLPLNPDLLSICWLDLAYGDLAIRNLTGKWPFQDMKPEMYYLDKAPPDLKEIVHDVYEKRIVWDDGCYRSAAYFEKVGDFRAARTTYEAVIEEYPYNFYAHFRLARMLKDINRLAEAAEHYRISVNSKPDYLFSRLELGLVEVNLGRFNEAIRNLNRALTLSGSESNPGIRANIYYGLAAANANLGEWKQAMENIEESLRIFPDYESARQLREFIVKEIRNKR